MVSPIDLNADLGEGYGRWTLGDDAAMLKIVTSANVACGFHAGDPATIRRTLAAAAERGVRIGAHVSYADLRGFGRRPVVIPKDELVADILYQIGALRALARSVGTDLAYVKPHGALYHAVSEGGPHAAAVLEALALDSAGLPLMAIAGCPAHSIAEDRGIRTISEAFADRAYDSDGSLVARTEPGAVLHDVEQILEHVTGIIDSGTVRARDGQLVEVRADSVCVHGDTADSVAIAEALRKSFDSRGILARHVGSAA